MTADTYPDFAAVRFDKENQRFTILDGTEGSWPYQALRQADVLNEKAKFRGHSTPFTALIAGGPLPPGLFTNPFVYVGLKLVLDDGAILGVYVSKEPVQMHTDQYRKDREKANEILSYFRRIMKKYGPPAA